MGRRVKKDVYTFSAGSWNLTSTKLFVYDGWNLIQELDGSGTIEKSYVWGLDLSETIYGSGGVGGLLVSYDYDASSLNYFCYDGNGNVGQVLGASDGSVQAHYEYDPFGNQVFSYGILANVNSFRFSTKYFDDETGMYYYGHRYYSQELGRWLNRDPEENGLNLYLFVRNNGINNIDVLGLFEQSQSEKTYTDSTGYTWTEEKRFKRQWSREISFKILSESSLGRDLIKEFKNLEKKGGKLLDLNKFTAKEYGVSLGSPKTQDLVIFIPEDEIDLFAADTIAHEITHQLHNYYSRLYELSPKLSTRGVYLIEKELLLATECVAHKAQLEVLNDLKKEFPSSLSKLGNDLQEAYNNDTLCQHIKEIYSKRPEPYKIPMNTCCSIECKRDRPLNFQIPKICHNQYIIMK